jgi:AcrR family transcriptional regulator
MPYRRTEKVDRKLAARRDAIITAARNLAAESGLEAVQIAPVAAAAGIAAGTIYRYFPSRIDLVAALVAHLAKAEIAALTAAADAAPGPLSGLAAAFATFAARALAGKGLALALMGETANPEAEIARAPFRRAVADELERRIRVAIDFRHLPAQDAGAAAAALVGALVAGLVGPLAPAIPDEAVAVRARVHAMTLFALRALGVPDARARGLVVHTPLPLVADARLNATSGPGPSSRPESPGSRRPG